MTKQRLVPLIGLVLVLAYGTLVPVGGQGEFSPDTLESRSRAEARLVWWGHTYHRGRLVQYLVDRGYWAPRVVERPRWIEMFHWNRRWRDGESELHKEIGWRASAWIEWTESHPELAAVVWPRVLTTLRADDRGAATTAAVMLTVAKDVADAAEFERELAAEESSSPPFSE
jgi:hypothetical protein